MKSLAHEILSFCKSVLNICLIKGQKVNSTCNNGASAHQKNRCYSFGWREPPLIGLLLAITLI